MGTGSWASNLLIDPPEPSSDRSTPPPRRSQARALTPG